MPLASVRRLAMATAPVVVAAVLIILFVTSSWSFHGGSAGPSRNPAIGSSDHVRLLAVMRPQGRKWV